MSNNIDLRERSSGALFGAAIGDALGWPYEDRSGIVNAESKSHRGEAFIRWTSALIQRCQEHKKRNVLDALPEGKRGSVKRALKDAFRAEDPELAERMLTNLARSLDEQHPGAAASLREGLEDLLTVKRLGLGGSSLERTLSSTNVIENLIGQLRQLSGRVKRWKSGRMILRWSAAGALEAERGFRRLKGYRQMTKLVVALQTHDAALDGERGTFEGCEGVHVEGHRVADDGFDEITSQPVFGRERSPGLTIVDRHPARARPEPQVSIPILEHRSHAVLGQTVLPTPRARASRTTSFHPDPRASLSRGSRPNRPRC